MGTGLVTDEGLVPDPETILKNFEAEPDHLFGIVKTGKMEPEALVYDGKASDLEAFLKSRKGEKGPKKNKSQ